MIKNYMEEAVANMLPSVLEKYKDICKCPLCLEDIQAIALNHLTPQYMSTEKGNVYLKMNELGTQFRMDILKEIVGAINTVSENPRHETKEGA